MCYVPKPNIPNIPKEHWKYLAENSKKVRICQFQDGHWLATDISITGYDDYNVWGWVAEKSSTQAIPLNTITNVIILG